MGVKSGSDSPVPSQPSVKGTSEVLAIGHVITDAGTQVRAAIDDAIVEDYAECLRSGGTLPVVTAFRDQDGRAYLADGFHRLRAYESVGRTEIDAEIHSGTREDALWCALGANRSHGQRLTGADKKHAIELAFEAWPERSQRRIAAQIGCSQQYVGKVRAQVTTSCHLPERTVGTDGKSYPAGGNTQTAASREQDDESASRTEVDETPAPLEARATQEESGQIPRSGTSSRRAQDRSNRIVSVVATDALNLTAQQELIDFAALDHDKLPEWIRELEDARRKLAAFIRRLKKEVSDANGDGQA